MPKVPHFFESTLPKVDQPLPADLLSRAQRGEEARLYCAYNQTRQRFLSAAVEAADFSSAALEDRMPALAPGSGLALWVVPFRGISAAIVRDPIDLLYLDSNCTVLDAVESFPLSHVHPSSKPAATVLVLPAQSIASSRTRSGDQLILDGPEEMKRHLRLQQAGVHSRPEPAPALPDTFAAGPPVASIPDSPTGIPAQQKTPQPKNWLQRLLSARPPDPGDLRRAGRGALPWVAAYFFTGGAPVAHAVRNISVSGLYILTEERWSPGTILRITLTDRRAPTVERSITVGAKVVRWGNDGVGLQFLYTDGKDGSRGQIAQMEDCLGGINRVQVEQFLERVRSETP